METAVITVIGKGLIAGAINDLYSFLKSSAHYEKLEQVLHELDVKAELDVVQALLEDINHHVECNAVRVASEQVKEAVNLIHKELEIIHAELEYHKTRYFANWRSPSYDQNINNLRQFRDQLRKRRELLISVISVQNNIHTSSVSRPRKEMTNSAPPVMVNKRKNMIQKLLEMKF